MPPPSQKGKFKPRKPAKKIKVGAATGAVPESAPSSSAATAAAVAASAASAAAPGRGRGGAGSPGRGGGRGRVPLPPQGQAFFTATPAPASKQQQQQRGAATAASKSNSTTDNKSTTTKKSTTKAKATTTLMEKKNAESSEEVVGMMEKGVGGATADAQGDPKGGRRVRSSKTKVEDNDMDMDDTTTPLPATSKSSDDPAAAGRSGSTGNKSGSSATLLAAPEFTYDSDSSAEQEARTQSQTLSRNKNKTIQPTRLPFPVAPLPVGVGGGSERPLTYDSHQANQNVVDETKPIMTSAATTTNHPMVEEPRPSPFVDPQLQPQDLQREMDSFFLFQFPTRLPAVIQQRQNSSTSAAKGMTAEVGLEEGMEHPDPTTTMPHNTTARRREEDETAEVSTAPVQTDAFDNALIHAKPGRLGKLVVYKSGKTVLVLQGPRGTEIRMNVSEGLTCSFEQQAVAIDPEQKHYVKLGDVHKTVVVTPDLGEAFGS